MKQNLRIKDVVLGLAVDDGGRYLLTLRNDPKRSSTHKHWQIPGGGMEFGESAEQTLVRELEEEIAVTPRIIFPYPIIKHHVWKKKGYAIQLNLLCFLIDIGNQEVRPDGYETLDFRWVEYHESKSLNALPNTFDFIHEAQKIHIEHHN